MNIQYIKIITIFVAKLVVCYSSVSNDDNWEALQLFHLMIHLS